MKRIRGAAFATAAYACLAVGVALGASWDERVSRFRPQAAANREHHVASAERTIERLAMRYAPTRDLPALDPTR